MSDRLGQQMFDVVVVQVIQHPAAVAATDHEPQMTQHSQLMRDRRGLHPDRFSQLSDAQRAIAQTPEDPDPARGRQRLHRARDHGRERLVELVAAAQMPMSHHDHRS